MKKIATLCCLLAISTAYLSAGSGEDATRKLQIDTKETQEFSPYVFGHNLEHTRAAVNGGLSAQMLRNRKFAGKPSKNQGVSSQWFGIGEKTFFFTDDRDRYTKHICLEKMVRKNELQAQCIQNMNGGSVAGMGQYDLAVSKGTKYQLRMVTKVSAPVSLKIELGNREGTQVYASASINLSPAADWVTNEFSLTPSVTDKNACIKYTFTDQATVKFGALSMLPEDNFHGMRKDVVDNLKAIGPAILRWPGGNFAGEYRWKDGLLPVDQRGCLCAATEIETQPYTDGFDFHELNTDDFIALCREVGAEPFLTINLVWSTPQESVEWLEYCNGAADTPYGKMRAERGFPEPYNVKYWSLGNEMGYSHMEGPMLPQGYAALAEKHAAAMIAKEPDLKLFSSGPYPNDSWAMNSAARLADKAPYVSLHYYSGPSAYSGAGFDYTTEEGIKATYQKIVASVEGNFKSARRMRECLDKTGKKMHISFDEWNQWFSWYRPSCTGEAIFTAKYLHNIISVSNELDIPVCCYFQPVGEGAIIITPESSRLTANGQVFEMMKAHKGGRLCKIEGNENCLAVASVKDKVMTVTLINESYDEEACYELLLKGKLNDAKLLSCDDVRPYTYFNESKLPVNAGKKSFKTTLPPHSVASIEIIL